MNARLERRIFLALILVSAVVRVAFFRQLRGTDFANWLAVQGRIKSPLEIQSPRNDNIWLQVSAVALRENERLIILRDFTDVHNVEQIRRDFVANIFGVVGRPRFGSLAAVGGQLPVGVAHRADNLPPLHHRGERNPELLEQPHAIADIHLRIDKDRGLDHHLLDIDPGA